MRSTGAFCLGDRSLVCEIMMGLEGKSGQQMINS